MVLGSKKCETFIRLLINLPVPSEEPDTAVMAFKMMLTSAQWFLPRLKEQIVAI